MQEQWKTALFCGIKNDISGLSISVKIRTFAALKDFS